MSIADRILRVKSSLPGQVELVAVSKTYPAQRIMEAYEAGQRIFGENRPQEMAQKYETMTNLGATVVGPVPLPTEKNVFVVIRSPHKYKDSREHFEMRTHKRLIDIVDPTPKAVDSLMHIDLPADVNIEIKL